MARVAGVLAIAILGIVMVKVFGSRTEPQPGHLSLPPAMLQEIQAEETKLADLQAPAMLDSGAKAAFGDFVRQAFVSGFRVVMLICASLSLASAAVAGRMIGKGPGRAGLAEPSDNRQNQP